MAWSGSGSGTGELLLAMPEASCSMLQRELCRDRRTVLNMGVFLAGGQGGRCVPLGSLQGKEGEAQELS